MLSGEQNYFSGMVIVGLDRNCRFLHRKMNYIFSLCRYPDKKPYFTWSGLPVFPPFYQCPPSIKSNSKVTKRQWGKSSHHSLWSSVAMPLQLSYATVVTLCCASLWSNALHLAPLHCIIADQHVALYHAPPLHLVAIHCALLHWIVA